MNNNFSYNMPTKIVYGNNSFDSLDKYINGRKTLLVTSEGFLKRGLLNRVDLTHSNIVNVISNVKSHPEFNDLEIVYNKIKNIDFELIVAIGGGSVLDASKFFSVQNEKKDYRYVEDIVKGKKDKKGYKLVPIISIPTTAGTGSEITPWATIWDMFERKKYSLHLNDLYSEVAIYDPLLTLSVPRDITIQTGLDTLSHALESIWNKNANEITISYAIKSAKLIMENLLNLSNELNNLTYRDNVMKACMYAGLAFSNTQTAIAHSMSYYITTHKKIPHGIACSFTLPMLIDNIINKYDFIDKAIETIFGELSSKPLRKLLKSLEVSIDFESYGIGIDEVLSNVDTNRLNNSLITKKDFDD